MTSTPFLNCIDAFLRDEQRVLLLTLVLTDYSFFPTHFPFPPSVFFLRTKLRTFAIVLVCSKPLRRVDALPVAETEPC